MKDSYNKEISFERAEYFYKNKRVRAFNVRGGNDMHYIFLYLCIFEKNQKLNILALLIC